MYVALAGSMSAKMACIDDIPQHVDIGRTEGGNKPNKENKLAPYLASVSCLPQTRICVSGAWLTRRLITTDPVAPHEV